MMAGSTMEECYNVVYKVAQQVPVIARRRRYDPAQHPRLLVHTVAQLCCVVHVNSSGGTYTELSYVGQDCERIPPVLTQVYGARVRCLDLSFNSLTSLAGLERFTSLRSLVLDNNMLPDSFHLPRLPHLHTLSLNKNKLRDLDTLLQQVSNHAPHVRHLSLLGNIACPNQLSDASKDEDDYRRYRYYVLYRLPELQFLDSSVVTEYERIEAQRCGRFMRVVKPQKQFSVPTSSAEMETTEHYSPLPMTRRDASEHQGAYGRCRFRYSGKHSEGNRFIQNQDL